jgi:hypothetical protein
MGKNICNLKGMNIIVVQHIFKLTDITFFGFYYAH